MYQKPGKQDDRFLPGLLDVAQLRRQRRGKTVSGRGKTVSGRGMVGAKSPQSRGMVGPREIDATADASTTNLTLLLDITKNVNTPRKNAPVEPRGQSYSRKATASPSLAIPASRRDPRRLDAGNHPTTEVE